VEGGADILELGIPFSDPIADGPIIQRATHLALEQGVTPRDCLGVFRRLREVGVEVPLLAMTYYNPILRYGLGKFPKALAQAGGDGLIVPDLPPEEAADLMEACRKEALALVFLLAPTSTLERIERIARASTGFIYLVSVEGITGPREGLPSGLEELVARVRERAESLPLGVGFGVSGPAQAKAIAGYADGVIVGSAVVRLCGEQDGPIQVRRFLASLRQAMDGN
ncbi:MAG: tryptophan synthase subunit alpha, partial [Chloroflexota bacterium]|nr:tryptophan synthase subunit alpha [Chloroflexota bacterium]